MARYCIHLDEVFVICIIPEGSNVNFTGNIARGQTRPMAVIEIRNGNRAYKQVYVKNEPHIRSQDLKKPLNRQFSHYK